MATLGTFNLADEVLLVDNSSLRPTLLAAIDQGVPIGNQLDPTRPFHARFLSALEQAPATAPLGHRLAALQRPTREAFGPLERGIDMKKLMDELWEE